MKYTIVALFCFLTLVSFTNLHKFYVSVTEIEHNETARSLQIISRVFTDDFEDVLKLRYDPAVRLGRDVESPGAKRHIKKYLEQKLEIEINGTPGKLNYLGMEYDNDMILLYLEVPNIKQVKSIKVKNTVLMDMFEEQKNLVHVEVKGKVKSLVLAGGNVENSIKF